MYMAENTPTRPQTEGWCWSLTRDITAAEVVSELLAAFSGQQGVKGAFNLSEGKIVSPQVLGGRDLMLTICRNYHIKSQA